jgi:putative addiction module component (TIGR02574 family)
MMNTAELIDEVASLPVEERARVVDTLLRSLNAPESAIDAAWMEVAQHRLGELRAGRVEAVPGEAVFERIRQRYSK